MSPHAGEIYRSWFRVCPSVRNASLVWAISPRILHVEISNFLLLTYLLKLFHKKKTKFKLIFYEVLAKKDTFKICVLSGSYLSNDSL